MLSYCCYVGPTFITSAVWSIEQAGGFCRLITQLNCLFSALLSAFFPYIGLSKLPNTSTELNLNLKLIYIFRASHFIGCTHSPETGFSLLLTLTTDYNFTFKIHLLLKFCDDQALQTKFLDHHFNISSYQQYRGQWSDSLHKYPCVNIHLIHPFDLCVNIRLTPE